ncbi:uncharacterized protein B0H18DRAFT_1124663 [Fomitopsis serialis]|uniref:uncharacterized protein n=1 Tax=Fomitopsis serialis TaxID=139415 RepID=UPI00200887D4|nr:uncharacterized protein B0H18DRAFT_1124663 [Neoantrodia serialis]KAH9915844.1 hypothetical protein B0H18DRAFT_1124663 [Neoantrodia serialis]
MPFAGAYMSYNLGGVPTSFFFFLRALLRTSSSASEPMGDHTGLGSSFIIQRCARPRARLRRPIMASIPPTNRPMARKARMSAAVPFAEKDGAPPDPDEEEEEEEEEAELEVVLVVADVVTAVDIADLVADGPTAMVVQASPD